MTLVMSGWIEGSEGFLCMGSLTGNEEMQCVSHKHYWGSDSKAVMLHDAGIS